MMKSGVFGRKDGGDSRWSRRGTVSISPVFLPVAMMIALLLGVVVGSSGPSIYGFAVGAIIMAVIIVLRQDELAVTMVIVVHLYVDWYLGLEIVGAVMALGLLLIFLLVRSPQYPWIAPRALWLWCLFLVLTIAPVIQGAQGLYDLAYYYPHIIFGALVIFWLGMIVVQSRVHLQKLFKMLAGVGTLLSLHTLIQAATGIVLFGSTRFDTFLIQVSGFELANSSVHRVGSFFENPDWNGTFFSMMLFLPLSLFAKSSSLPEKLFYLVEMFLILIALFFTYSIGAMLGAFAGVIAFILFVGRGRYRILMPLLMTIFAGAVMVSFPSEVNLLLQHAANPGGLSLRFGAWQTAIRVISAFPLTGVGLSLSTYLQRAEPYRVPTQYLPLAHPHNAYLELGAMAGLPVMIVFIALLLFALWQAWRHWLVVDSGTRSLIGGGIAAVIVLSVNSLSINGWTLPPLAAIGWLILGAVASPLNIKDKPVKESDIQL